MKYLIKMKDMEWLELNDTQITNAGISEIKVLENIVDMNLRNTDVSDKCITSLKKMKNLSTLYIDGTEITEEGIAKLEKSLPYCRVEQ